MSPLFVASASSADLSWDPIFSPHDHSSYYPFPPSPPNSVGSSTNDDSPVPTTRMLKSRLSPDSLPDDQQLCFPTHQVFDFPEVPQQPPTPSSPAPSSLADDLTQPLVSKQNSPVSCSTKRSASPAPITTKKRAVGERISSKDFVPPDVSGLSKREARLVKNRAAAFLSRQRKREEFETMEIRVAELEEENARLLALTKTGSHVVPMQSHPDNDLVSEVELLRAQLAAAKERELKLSVELTSKSTTRDAPIKLEAPDSAFPLSSPPRATPNASPLKSGASLGLMVLLCALPTLLSMPMQSTTPTSFSLPTPFPATSSAVDFNSYLPNEYDWSRTNGHPAMDLDIDEHGKVTARSAQPTMRTLEFSGTDSGELGALGGLDISFDASPSENGKIRVRIHPSSSASSRAASPGASYSTAKSPTSPSSSSLGMWSGGDSGSSIQATFASHAQQHYSTPSSANDDPFLGVGASNDYGMAYTSSASSLMYGQMNEFSSLDYGQMSDQSFSMGSEYDIPDNTGSKRRVRIALKSMPAAGGEGGEWEVQIC